MFNYAFTAADGKLSKHEKSPNQARSSKNYRSEKSKFKFENFASERINDNEHIGPSRGFFLNVPMLFGIIPIIWQLFFREFNNLMEWILFGIILIWVHYTLKSSSYIFVYYKFFIAPWMLFFKSRQAGYDSNQKFFIVMIFVSPFLAAFFLLFVKNFMNFEQNILKNFSIPLFLGSALISPIRYFLRDNPAERDIEDIRELHYQIGMLLDRIERLEQLQDTGSKPTDYDPQAVNASDLDRLDKQMRSSLKKVINTENRVNFVERELESLKKSVESIPTDGFIMGAAILLQRLYTRTLQQQNKVNK